ncbi:MAG: hypothetical protein ACFFD1_12285 [Candidatus Thorarchaeota archaeon]
MLVNKRLFTDQISETKIQISSINENFYPWLLRASERIFSIAAGYRVARIAPLIMKVGFAKTLFAVNELGVDIESRKPFVFFGPDGTVTFNNIRLNRGYSYGCIIKSDYNGLIAPDSMPNGCGFSIYELHDDLSDDKRIKLINKKQKELGKEHIQQLGKGNHFAGVYTVLDKTTGEDTDKRFVVVHCSGHEGTNFLYEPNSWLSDTEGYYRIDTPHGPVTLLDGFAKQKYLEKYFISEKRNASNRTDVMEDVFGSNKFTILEEICHQGLSEDGKIHKLGSQIHEGLQPIAFNPEEGLIAITAKKSLKSSFLDSWDIINLEQQKTYYSELKTLNTTPHGGGYEMKYPINEFIINLDKTGIKNFDITFGKNIKEPKLQFTAKSFREIRENITYRRKLAIMKEVFKADLAEHVYDLSPNKQIYPLVTIPGGTH